jgi:hypothetical protein
VQVEVLRKEVEERRTQREGRLRYVREQHDKRAAERDKEKKEAQGYFTPEARSTQFCSNAHDRGGSREGDHRE